MSTRDSSPMCAFGGRPCSSLQPPAVSPRLQLEKTDPCSPEPAPTSSVLLGILILGSSLHPHHCQPGATPSTFPWTLSATCWSNQEPLCARLWLAATQTRVQALHRVSTEKPRLHRRQGLPQGWGWGSQSPSCTCWPWGTETLGQLCQDGSPPGVLHPRAECAPRGGLLCHPGQAEPQGPHCHSTPLRVLA